MNNLFSIFDPMIGSLPVNWLASSIIVIVMPQMFWFTKNQFSTILTMTVKFVYSEFNAILGNKFNPGGILLPLGMFLFIAINNFPGLLSYVFTSSSHLTFTVSLALPLWIGHLLLAWMKTPVSMLAHLVPLGTPYPLTPFMVLIELVSNLIRPLTLSVRLAANMVAGHLLLTLLSSQACNLSLMVLLFLMSGLIILMLLEAAVALIQAYVFSVLSTLYLNEVTSFKMS